VLETIAARYALLDVLGSGGMGVVHRAHDGLLDRTVAVKLLAAHRATDPEFVARFEREARAAGALNHPNIVAVFDAGIDGSKRYIVIEYVPGISLAQLLRERGALPPAQAREIAAGIASALAAAHARGIIHRDIKPANVMVDEAGTVKVLDFGIARSLSDETITQTAMVLGSARYLAPEVINGAPADARSDIYALGCVLYEMLVGNPPFSGELTAAVMHQHGSSAPDPPRRLRPEIPPELDALVLAMLAKAPADRPQSAREVLARLSGDATSPTIPVGQTAATAVLPAAVPTGRARRVPLLAAVVTLLCLALAAAAIALTGSSGSGKRAAHRTPPTRAKTAASARTTNVRTVTSTATVTTPPATPAPALASPAPKQPKPHDHGPPGGPAKPGKGGH
jgi:serine/threonine-protein kinase